MVTMLAWAFDDEEDKSNDKDLDEDMEFCENLNDDDLD